MTPFYSNGKLITQEILDRAVAKAEAGSDLDELIQIPQGVSLLKPYIFTCPDCGWKAPERKDRKDQYLDAYWHYCEEE